MSENAQPTEDDATTIKTAARSRWRDKLFSSESRRERDGNEQGSNEDEVAQFLGSSASKAKTRPPPLPIITPRLNTDEVQQQSVAPPESDLSPVQDRYHKPRPPLKKGLTVSFERTPPCIIGEGGDDAQLPTREVTRSLAQLDIDGPPSASLHRRFTGVLSHTDATPALRNLSEGAKQEREHLLYDERETFHTQDRERHHEAGLHQSQQLSSSTSEADRGREILRRDTETSMLRKPPSRSPNNLSPDHGSQKGNSLTPTPSPRPHSRSAPALSAAPHIVQPSAKEPSQSQEIRSSPNRGGKKSDEVSRGHRTFNLREVAQGLSRDALDEFDASAQALSSIFQSSTAAHIMAEISFSAWIRAAAWWFLKGRQELERAVRARPRSPHKIDDSASLTKSRSLMQAYVDLSKAWWIVKDISPNHPDIKRYGNASMPSMVPIIESFGNRELAVLVEVHVAIIANLRALTMSMKRNNRLPPQSFDVQGLDAHVMLEYPNLPRQIVNSDYNFGRELTDAQAIFMMPIGDTANQFSFGRMFAKTSINFRPNRKENARFMCMVSTIQSRRTGNLLALIASQDGQVSITVDWEKDHELGVRWSDLQWIKHSHIVLVPLARDFDLQLALTEADYAILEQIYNSYLSAIQICQRHENETLVTECVLHSFERLEMPNEPGGFPQGSVPDCTLRVFSKAKSTSSFTPHHEQHAGHRLVVRTPPSVKSLHAVSIDVGGEKPILFSPWRPEDGPSLIVRAPNSPSLFLQFGSQSQVDSFRALLSGITELGDESLLSPLPLQAYEVSMAELDGKSTNQGLSPLQGLRWRQVQLIAQKRQTQDQLSGRLEVQRLLVKSDFGYFVDRLNGNPGELQIGLGVGRPHEIKLFRSPQTNMTWSLEDRLPKDVIELADHTLSAITRTMTIRTFNFTSLKDLHKFESRVTGFSVLFDGNASKFAISRRRMVVPLHKHWEATSVRLQILQRDKVIQLAAFFVDFPHGSCMNLELKPTDVFESSSRSGSFLLRIVDAKFPMPKSGDLPNRDFVCLDIPEYPGEHDDITLGFDSEEMRDQFAGHLPAQVNKASRLGSFRR